LAAPVVDIGREANLGSAFRLAGALDRQDSRTARHSETVAELCVLLGTELGFDERRLERLRLAVLLHDIGKIWIPNGVLDRPGPLTALEWEAMRRHPELGAQMLGDAGLDQIQGWVLAHHERPDGTGYPMGLRAGEIPIEASILAVADAYDAMTSERAYRPALGHKEALAELREGAGTQFDAEVVEVFLEAVGSPTVPVAVGSRT
jgi:putative nucleotidyltransferase with HDIG domain